MDHETEAVVHEDTFKVTRLNGDTRLAALGIFSMKFTH